MGAAGPEITAHSKIHYLLFSHKNESAVSFKIGTTKPGQDRQNWDRTLNLTLKLCPHWRLADYSRRNLRLYSRQCGQGLTIPVLTGYPRKVAAAIFMPSEQ